MTEKITDFDEKAAPPMLQFHDYGMGEFDARHRIGPVYCSHFDLLATHSGCVEIQFADNQSVKLPAGQALLVSPHMRFAGASLEPVSRVSVQHFLPVNCEGAGYPNILKRLCGRRGDWEAFVAPPVEVLADIERAVELSRRPPSPALHQVRESILLLILSLLIDKPAARMVPGAVGEDFSDLTQWMLGRLDQPLTLEDMAQFVGRSASHFRALFRKQMGCPPIYYLHHLRHSEASRLLRETAMPIKAVARRVGYDQLTHFYRFFKAFSDYTPAEYRRIYYVKG